MADILIRGVRMPIACSDCPSRDVSVCVWTDDYNVESYKFSRPSFCPLRELPPHGDLIDREWLTEMAYSKVEYFGGAFLDTIDIAIAPLVVPSNKERSEDE